MVFPFEITVFQFMVNSAWEGLMFAFALYPVFFMTGYGKNVTWFAGPN